MLNYSLGLRIRMEGHRWKILQEILSIYQSIWKLIFMIRFGIGTQLVEKRALPGRWIGISHRIGAGICYWVFNEQFNVISRSTVKHDTKEDLLNPTLKETLKLADEKQKLEPYSVNKLFHEDMILNKEEERDFDDQVPEGENYTEALLDTVIGANVTLQHNVQTIKSNIMK